MQSAAEKKAAIEADAKAEARRHPRIGRRMGKQSLDEHFGEKGEMSSYMEDLF